MTNLDLEPLYMLLSDPKVMRFPEPPYTREAESLKAKEFKDFQFFHIHAGMP